MLMRDIFLGKGYDGMDMKAKTSGSFLTAMVCVALSSGTAWAATPELPASAFVQQQAAEARDYNTAALAQASVENVISEEKARDERAKNFDLSSGAEPRQQGKAQESVDLHKMPLRWQAVKTTKELEAESKPQPLIITADDIEKQRKEQKKQEAAEAVKQAAPKQTVASELQQKPQPAQTAVVEQQAKVPELPATPAVSRSKVKLGEFYQPQQPAQSQQKPDMPVVNPQPTPARQQPAPAASQPIPARPQLAPAAPQPAPARPQSAPVAPQPSQARPNQPPAVSQMNESKPQARPSMEFPPYKMEPKAAPISEPVNTPPQRPADNANRVAAPQANMAQPPKQIRVERPPEFEGISDEVVRHILAGEFAMMYQLSHDPSEPGVYKLTKILKNNDGLTHLQKIEYLIGFGRAINKSDLSEWQKCALIKTVAAAFE